MRERTNHSAPISDHELEHLEQCWRDADLGMFRDKLEFYREALRLVPALIAALRQARRNSGFPS
jgi:hypothetical protein